MLKDTLDKHVTQFKHDGMVTIERVFSATEMATLRDLLDRTIEQAKADLNWRDHPPEQQMVINDGEVYVLWEVYERCPDAARFTLHPAIVRFAEVALGGPVVRANVGTMFDKVAAPGAASTGIKTISSSWCRRPVQRLIRPITGSCRRPRGIRNWRTGQSGKNLRRMRGGRTDNGDCVWGLGNGSSGRSYESRTLDQGVFCIPFATHVSICHTSPAENLRKCSPVPGTHLAFRPNPTACVLVKAKLSTLQPPF